MGEEHTCHFGKHEGEKLSEIPSGYLRWACENIDPKPLPKYQKDDDGNQLSVEEVKAMEDRMRDFLAAAAEELNQRDES